ncbi:TPA: acyltransferase [Enterobacter asburiae]|uniref:acyltransferase family protein n=1 Tax=Enterobacter asburiae TaxID=61645 RepID=UPI0015E58E04|nr:acyltransferase [Enterobacter asburiae]QLO47416.1 acyltransferase [Enterobacter cloacae]QLR28611.1 acyltransferase [Enterobacter asburiae]HDR2644812.1 acyltransferase [Enterobacter asburiae]HDT5075898.1 acyltransferase [Enterobacter asburiae]
MKIYSIHYLRGIAALFVVLFHFRSYMNNVYAQSNLGDILFSKGAFGVDLFFVISGFIICFATEKEEFHSSLKFVIRRFFRIYPLLIFSMLVYFLVVVLRPESHDLMIWFLWSIIPLHVDYHAGAPFFGYNMLGIAWTLTYEVSFYFIFLIAMSISHKYRMILSSTILISMVIMSQMLSGSPTLDGLNNNYIINDFITLISSPIYIDFVYGIITYCVFKKVKISENRKGGGILSALLICIVVITTSSIFLTKDTNHGPLSWGFMAFVIALCMTLLEDIVRKYDSALLDVLGNVSFSLYMCHYIIIEIYNKYFHSESFTGASALVMMTTISVMVSILLFRFVEMPSVNASKKLTAIVDSIGQKQFA